MEDDTYYEIAEQAISQSEQNNVPVAGRDTDIPILLCHFYDPLKQNIIF
jgi:hypothetical protein